jgi:hypothetical protein
MGKNSVRVKTESIKVVVLSDEINYHNFNIIDEVTPIMEEQRMENMEELEEVQDPQEKEEKNDDFDFSAFLDEVSSEEADFDIEENGDEDEEHDWVSREDLNDFKDDLFEILKQEVDWGIHKSNKEIENMRAELATMREGTERMLEETNQMIESLSAALEGLRGTLSDDVLEDITSPVETSPEPDPEPEAVEEEVIATEEALPPPPITPPRKMQAATIARIFKSWAIFKDLGTAGMGRQAAYKFRLIGTDYVMYVPVMATYTWQVRWAKDCLEDIAPNKRVKVNREVTMMEVFNNSTDEIRQILQENRHLFVKS